ncbi:MAG: tRNA lysidine(34) synthetase TilS [Myxococcaceae bacterium]
MPLDPTPTDPFLDTLKAGWVRLGGRGVSVLLAVSGGGDSTALLVGSALLLEELGLTLEVACVDHGLRPESKAEQHAVAELARRHGLRFHGLTVTLVPGPELEARAREVRYRALEETRASQGLTWTATAHTATDQAETLLMRLARGTALAGAAGIRARRGRVLRPMLTCTREEVRDFLDRRGITFHEDPMNLDPAFLRVRVRTEVLPALERAVGGASVIHLARYAQLAAEDEAVLQEQARASLQRIRLGQGELDAVGLRALPAAIRRRVLVAWLVELGERVDFLRVQAIDDALMRGKEAPLGGRAVARTVGDRVRRVTSRPLAPVPEVALVQDGPPVPFGDQCLRWRSVPGAHPGQPLPEEVAGPLTVRTRRPGDRVRSSAERTRKLQDVLVDARVPRELRDAVPLVVDQRGLIVCIAGIWPRPDVERSAGGVIEVLPKLESGACPGAAL